MRWLLWSSLAIGLLFALWAGSFAAVFELGPGGMVGRDDAGRAIAYRPNLRAWATEVWDPYHVEALLAVEFPWLRLWASVWGYRLVQLHRL